MRESVSGYLPHDWGNDEKICLFGEQVLQTFHPSVPQRFSLRTTFLVPKNNKSSTLLKDTANKLECKTQENNDLYSDIKPPKHTHTGQETFALQSP